MHSTVDILGIPIANIDMGEALDFFKEFLNEDKLRVIFTPNAEIIMAAVRNPELSEILCSADLLIPDGAGVVLASRILGTPLKEKVSGIDLTRESFRVAPLMGATYFLLGGRPGIAEAAANKIKADNPDAEIAGFHHGYFNQEEETAVVEEINSSGAAVLLVGMGVPKQERWIRRQKDSLNVRVCIGVGGSLDILAGTVKLAPPFFRDHGLEWLYRLAKEPWRYKRMLDLPRFMFRVIITRLSGKRKKTI